MAKRKTPKSDKVIDLKAKTITEEELKSIQEITTKINTVSLDIGTLESRKHQFLHVLAGLHDEARLVQSKLEDTYGKCDINLDTGDIQYLENGEVNKKD